MKNVANYLLKNCTSLIAKQVWCVYGRHEYAPRLLAYISRGLAVGYYGVGFIIGHRARFVVDTGQGLLWGTGRGLLWGTGRDFSVTHGAVWCAVTYFFWTAHVGKPVFCQSGASGTCRCPGDICMGGETLYRVQILRRRGEFVPGKCFPPETSYRCKVSGEDFYFYRGGPITGHRPACPASHSPFSSRSLSCSCLPSPSLPSPLFSSPTFPPLLSLPSPYLPRPSLPLEVGPLNPDSGSGGASEW